MRVLNLSVLVLAGASVMSVGCTSKCADICGKRGTTWGPGGQCVCRASDCNCPQKREDNRGSDGRQKENIPDPIPTPDPTAQAHLSECQMIVLPGVDTDLAIVAKAASRMQDGFNRLGVPLRNPAGVRVPNTVRATIEGVARLEDADLVAIVTVNVEEVSRTRGFRMRADARCNIYDALGDVFIRASGEKDSWDTVERVAARSAVDAALDELEREVARMMIADIGSDAIVRRVTIRGFDDVHALTELQNYLMEQDGVIRVRRGPWDAASQVANLTVYMSPYVVDNLGSYCVGAPGHAIEVVSDRDAALSGTREVTK